MDEAIFRARVRACVDSLHHPGNAVDGLATLELLAQMFDLTADENAQECLVKAVCELFLTDAVLMLNTSRTGVPEFLRIAIRRLQAWRNLSLPSTASGGRGEPAYSVHTRSKIQNALKALLTVQRLRQKQEAECAVSTLRAVLRTRQEQAFLLWLRKAEEIHLQEYGDFLMSDRCWMAQISGKVEAVVNMLHSGNMEAVVDGLASIMLERPDNAARVAAFHIIIKAVWDEATKEVECSMKTFAELVREFGKRVVRSVSQEDYARITRPFPHFPLHHLVFSGQLQGEGQCFERVTRFLCHLLQAKLLRPYSFSIFSIT